MGSGLYDALEIDRPRVVELIEKAQEALEAGAYADASGYLEVLREELAREELAPADDKAAWARSVMEEVTRG